MKYLSILMIFFAVCVKAEENCKTGKLSHLLGVAVAQNDISGVRFAIELGADPNGLSERISKSCFGGMPSYVPVILAAELEDVTILELLLKNGASPKVGCCGSSALEVAQAKGNLEAVDILISYGAN